VKLFLVYLLNLPVVLCCRALDLLVLLPRPRLLGVYLMLWAAELLRSPYRRPRSFEVLRQLKERGGTIDELVYGELPVVTALWLLRRAGLGRGHTLLDPLAGRGRPLLAARWLGAGARGVELQALHVEPVERWLRLAQIQLEQGDAREAPLGTPSHVLLNWAGLSDRSRDQLEARLALLPAETRFISVGAPLRGSEFQVSPPRRALFTWGMASVYFARRVSRP
jgi:hypothetical protein